MNSFLRFLLTALLMLNTFCDGNNLDIREVVLAPSYYTDLYGWNADGGLGKTMLGRGINMGNFLEAEDNEGSWTDGRLILENDFAVIKKAGFKTVRIPVRWSDHTSNTGPSYTIDSAFMERVKQVVDWALAQDLRVVLNVHHYNEMMDTTDSSDVDSFHRPRLVKMWEQICDTFDTTNYPVNKVVFELLNEPNGRVGYDKWNTIITELTDIIWNDKGQTNRKIMVGTANWGGVPGLDKLQLPAASNSNNTIITIHYYEPFHFTHQGASWTSGAEAWIGTSWTGTDQEQQDFTALLDQIVTWNSGKNFEIFVGEFGVYSKYADPSHQKAWTAFLTREAEKRGFAWAYWEFCSGFGAYDLNTDDWRPQLIQALIPADL